jgi:GT2 family glycosyltransferase
MEKIGLVTITYNSANVIDAFIDSVNRQDFPDFCLYIIDNNSTDGTLKKIEAKANPANTVILKNNFNNGVAGGNNQGIKKALEDACAYVLLINNDTEFEPALISKLYSTSKQKKYSVVVPKMMYYSEPQVIWFGGGYFKKTSGYINYHVGMGEVDKGQYVDREITYAPTCCTLIHRQVFEDIGLMDEKYFVYFDDTDFCYRMLKDARHKMFYINDIKFFHKVGSLTKSKSGTREKFKFGNFSVRYTTRNRVYYLKKQKSFFSYANILWFWFRINLRFLFSGKYNINLSTLKLITKSFWEGVTL